MFELFTTKFDKIQKLLTSLEDKKTLTIPAKKTLLENETENHMFRWKIPSKTVTEKILRSSANNWGFLPKDAEALKIAWTILMTFRLLAPQSHRLAPIHSCVQSLPSYCPRAHPGEQSIFKELKCWGIHFNCWYIVVSLHLLSLFITKNIKAFYLSTRQPNFCVFTNASFLIKIILTYGSWGNHPLTFFGIT